MATIAARADSAAFSIGRVISRTFGAVGSNFITFFVIALVARLPIAAAAIYTGPVSQIGMTPQQVLANALAPRVLMVTVPAGILTGVLSLVLQASVVRGTLTSLNGQRASFIACLATGFGLMLPVLGVGILVSLGALLGFLLLIVPGIMLFLRWAVAIPVRVAEGPGILNAMGRSAELTKGHRWAIFGTFVVIVLISIGIGMVVGIVGGIAMVSARQQAVIINVAVTSLGAAIGAVLSAAAIASIYYELRTIKEGAGPEQLAAVFA